MKLGPEAMHMVRTLSCIDHGPNFIPDITIITPYW